MFITSPPKNHKINTTKNVVNEVTRVLDRDSLILLLIMLSKLVLVDDFIFSLILSKITMYHLVNIQQSLKMQLLRGG